MKIRILTAIAAVATAACQPDTDRQERDDSASPTESHVRDSAGILITENPRPLERSRLGWRIGPEPTVTNRQAFLEGQKARYRTGVDATTGLATPESFLEETIWPFLESFTLAEHLPAFSTVLADAAGHLWVREYDLPREENPVPLWTVFDPEGRVLGFVETPNGLDILQIGEDFIVGRVKDEFEVEYVQVWPLVRSGG